MQQDEQEKKNDAEYKSASVDKNESNIEKDLVFKKKQSKGKNS